MAHLSLVPLDGDGRLGYLDAGFAGLCPQRGGALTGGGRLGLDAHHLLVGLRGGYGRPRQSPHQYLKSQQLGAI